MVSCNEAHVEIIFSRSWELYPDDETFFSAYKSDLGKPRGLQSRGEGMLRQHHGDVLTFENKQATQYQDDELEPIASTGKISR